MLSLPIVFLTCAALSAQAPIEAVKLNITINGGAVGQNVYELWKDGTFKSVTDLALSSAVKVHSEATGKFESGRLVQYSVTNSGQGQSVTISLDKGKLTMRLGGQVKDLPLKLGNEPYYGNLHPQFTASALKAIDYAKKSAQTIKCFMPDAATFLNPRITPEQDKSTALGRARMFDDQQPPLAIEYALDDAGHVVAMDVPMQKLRFIASGWEALYADPLSKYPELSQPTFKVKTEDGLKMKTRDGVALAADVYRPDAPGKYPVILERTPYGREGGVLDGAFYAKRGYIVVSQDCRGRGDSGGEWDPLVHERKDGYDAVQWASKLPWSDGNVGMIGGSYGGLVQWTAAVEQPPALKCIVPQVSPPDAFLNLPYDNGIFFLYGAVWWSKVVAGKGADMSSLMRALPHPENFGALPLSKVCEAVLGKDVSFFAKWVSRTRSSDWEGYNYEADLKKVTIPALNISGWWDGDQPGTMTNWSIMRSLGRTNQWLIYGPWSHLFNSTTKLGDQDFGSTAVIDLDSLYLRWFDTWLKHKNVGQQKVPHVKVFITGSNKWVESTDWPLANSTKKTLYFEADGPADGALTHGALLDAPRGSETPSKYTFDPKTAKFDKRLLDPDPNKASSIIKMGNHSPGTLFFKSGPMSSDIVVTGPITVSLSFSTSAYDTDLFANMVDVDENGKIHALGEAGKIRCSYLQGFDKQVALKPGRVYKANFRLWDFAHQFKKGHRIGMVVRSDAFPMFARNLGTIDPIRSATRMIVQNQKIYHDARHPSTVTFQVSQ